LKWRRRESNPRRRSASDESQEDPDLASPDADESALKALRKRQAANADDELPSIHPGSWTSSNCSAMAKHGSPAQLALFEATETRRRRRRYVPTYGHHSAEALRHTNEVLDRLLAQRRGLNPYEGVVSVAAR